MKGEPACKVQSPKSEIRCSSTLNFPSSAMEPVTMLNVKITKRTHFANSNCAAPTMTYGLSVRNQKEKRTHFPASRPAFLPPVVLSRAWSNHLYTSTFSPPPPGIDVRCFPPLYFHEKSSELPSANLFQALRGPLPPRPTLGVQRSMFDVRCSRFSHFPTFPTQYAA
jgi:hypothetical protein